MNRFAPVLQTYNDSEQRGEAFELSGHITPLSELDIFDFETPQCVRFVKEIGGLLLEWGEVGILQPSLGCESLGQSARFLHERFIEAQSKLVNIPATTQNMEQFIRGLSEDNAHAILHTLIGLGGFTIHNAGSELPPELMGADAIIEQRKLGGLASVSRSFAQAKIRPISNLDTRAADVIAYEEAVISGTPMPRISTASYFVLRKEVVRSPHASLSNGSWREPAMCAGFARLRAATSEKTKNNKQFMMGVETLVGAEDGWLQPRTNFSATDAGINFGVLAAMYSIYPNFPLVK